MSGVIAAAGITATAGLAGGLLGNKGSGGTQQQSTESQLPGWVQNAAMQNYGDATKASYEMPGPYQGRRVAQLTPEQQAMIRQLYGNVGSTNAGFDQATGMVNGLSGFNPATVNNQTLAGTNLNPYMNPYIKDVIDPSMQLFDQQRQNALNQIGANATGAHAFGGSRQGVAEGVTNSQSALQAGQFGAGLYGQGFGQAQQAAIGDINRGIDVQKFNSQAGMQGAQFQAGLAQQLANLTQAQQANFLTGTGAAMAGQGQLYDQQQKELDARKALYEEERQDPLQRIAIRSNQLSNSPYGQRQVQTSPGPSTDPWMTGIGTAATTAGIIGSLGRMNLFGSSTPNPLPSSSFYNPFAIPPTSEFRP